MTTLVATEPIIRARLKKARKALPRRVLGLRAKPVWDGDGFDYDGIPVTVVPCPPCWPSGKPSKAGMTANGPSCSPASRDDELGDTVLAHLVDGRLITPTRGMRCAATSPRPPSSRRCTDPPTTGR